MKKIFIGIGVVFGFLFLFMLLMVGVISVVNRPRGAKEEVIPGKEGISKKALIIYQPGISKFTTKMARQLAKGINAGGYEVVLNHPGNHLTTDLSEYALVVFGSPVYAGQISSTLSKYMERVSLEMAGVSTTRIVLFSTGSLEQTEEIDRITETLNRLKVVKKVKFMTGAKEENDKIAYDLGMELAEE